MTDKTNEIVALIEKAARAEDSGDALRFSQAACHAADALCAMKNATAYSAGGADPGGFDQAKAQLGTPSA